MALFAFSTIDSNSHSFINLYTSSIQFCVMAGTYIYCQIIKLCALMFNVFKMEYSFLLILVQYLLNEVCNTVIISPFYIHNL